ncbi:MAG: hypothetical protein U0636_04090 [Phycisphaerales bacterium]
MASPTPPYPEPSAHAELILRQRLFVETSGAKPYAVPELLILGNREGFEWLSKYFAYRAAKMPTEFQVQQNDADDHHHLVALDHPFSSKLSDELEIRVGMLTPQNRATTLAKYGFMTSEPQRGCLVKRYKQLIRFAKKAVRRRPDLSFLGFVSYTSRGWI